MTVGVDGPLAHPLPAPGPGLIMHRDAGVNCLLFSLPLSCARAQILQSTGLKSCRMYRIGVVCNCRNDSGWLRTASRPTHSYISKAGRQGSATIHPGPTRSPTQLALYPVASRPQVYRDLQTMVQCQSPAAPQHRCCIQTRSMSCIHQSYVYTSPHSAAQSDPAFFPKG